MGESCSQRWVVCFSPSCCFRVDHWWEVAAAHVDPHAGDTYCPTPESRSKAKPRQPENRHPGVREECPGVCGVCGRGNGSDLARPCACVYPWLVPAHCWKVLGCAGLPTDPRGARHTSYSQRLLHTRAPVWGHRLGWTIRESSLRASGGRAGGLRWMGHLRGSCVPLGGCVEWLVPGFDVHIAWKWLQ